MGHSKTQLLIMDKKDLFVALQKYITIIDIQKKEIIKYVKLNRNGFLEGKYKLSNNCILALLV